MSINLCLKRGLALAVAATAAQAVAMPTGGKHNDDFPELELPNNIRQVSYFGERPAWSPDGKKLAFMSKSFGDGFEMDMETEHVTLLTQYPNQGYLRVQYLPNGDLFLIGARNFTDVDTTRDEDQEMWVLKPNSTEPMPLNHKIWEGVAISRLNNTIAWTNSYRQYPDQFKEGENAIFTAEIVYDDDGKPSLTNKREALRAHSPECQLEPQDFFNNDSELTYTCYISTSEPQVGAVHSINLETGKTTEYRFVPGEYNEVEGIYPDGKYTLVESGHDQPANGNANIDIWRLSLEPDSNDFVRLTRFGDSPDSKSSNPVVSPDARYVAFQPGRSGDSAGVGYGVFLLDLHKHSD